MTQHLNENKQSNQKMELLAPAGGMDQLNAAVRFGADAVYLAANKFGMRARAKNFTMDDLKTACTIAHENNVKVYVTTNVLIMQNELESLPAFFEAIQDSGADALIIGDLGAFSLAKKYAPQCDLHVSTQASVANSATANMWYELGAKRIVCAREMSLEDIAKMRQEIPQDLEIETFVHGAQCMAISQRCLISSYLTGRSSNQGHCTQPCRWSYTLEEEMRPDIHFPIEEDEGRTFIMNAKDLNMIEHLKELKDAGVNSIKIEGRNKKALYVATVVRAYREALNLIEENAKFSEANLLDEKNIAKNVEHESKIASLQEELNSVSHRPYSTGFYFGEAEQAHDFDGYEQESVHVADVIHCKKSDIGYTVFLKCRNRFEEGESLEVLSPDEDIRELKISNLSWIYDPANDKANTGFNWGSPASPIDIANRSCNIYTTNSNFPIVNGSFLRSRQYRRSARHLN